MRWIVRSAIALIVLAIAYAAWPFWAAYDFVTAMRNRDAVAIERRVNFPALRYSLAEQIVVDYLKLSGKDARLGQFGRGMAVAAVASIAEPIVAKLISAEALMELLEGDSRAAAMSSTAVLQGLGSGSFDTVRQLLLHSEWGFRRFVLVLPVTAPPPRRFKLRFRLTSWTWKLSAVELPEALRNRLVQELVRQTERK
jgi:hypothetical protein